MNKVLNVHTNSLWCVVWCTREEREGCLNFCCIMQDLINSKTNCLFIALWWTVKSTSPWGNWTLKNKKEKILYKWKISKYTAHMAIKNIEYIQWKYSRCNPAVREQAYKNWKLIHDHLFLYLTQTHTFALLSILRTHIHTHNKAHICLQTRCLPPCPKSNV